MSDEEILATLKRIEGKLDESTVLSKKQWHLALGIGLMIGAIGILPYLEWVAAVVYLGGLIFILTFPKKLCKTSRITAQDTLTK